MVRPSTVPLYEKMLAIAFLFLAASTPFNFIRYLRGLPVDAGAEDTTQIIVLGLFYLLATIPVILQLGRAAWLWGQNVPLLGLMLLVAISPVWATMPIESLQRVLVYLGSMMAATYFALRYPPAELTRLIAIALLLVAGASLVAVLAMPDFGIMTDVHEGRWRGIFRHKNVLGRFMIFALFMQLLMAAQTRGLPRAFFLAAAALCGFIALKAQSATALAAALAILLIWPLLRWLRPRGARPLHTYAGVALGLCLAGIMLILTQSLFDFYVGLTGRDITLTDRVHIWQGAWAAIKDQPWLGYGYGVFWDRDRGVSYSYVRQFLLWDAPHAHNGLLEMTLHVGMVGSALFLASFGMVCVRVFRQLARPAEEPVNFALLVLLLTLCLNMTEVTLIVRTANLFWICYVYVALRSAYASYLSGGAAPGQHSANGAQ